MQYLYSENYKTLFKKMKEDLNKWGKESYYYEHPGSQRLEELAPKDQKAGGT